MQLKNKFCLIGKMKKIGVDGRLLQGNLTGVGKYVLNLINFICDQDQNIGFSIYTNQPVTCRFNSERVKIINDHRFKKIKPMVWSKFLAHRLINNDSPDIFLAGDAFLPFFMKPVKIVSVVHDLNLFIAPQTLGLQKRLSLKVFFGADIKKADVVISNSYGTAKKLKKYYNVDTTLVIYPILDKWFTVLDKALVKSKLQQLGINQPYILTVATQEPRKNLDKTINVFIGLKKKGRLLHHKLLLVGSKGWKSANIDHLLDVYHNDIERLGYIPDEDLPYLYNGADLFVFPSAYEGFGMPAREAMLCGVPVITTDIMELKEATNNKAVYINPNNADEYENAIKSLIDGNSIRQENTLIGYRPNDQIELLTSYL
jgi:glycosyltransferase involved in cell wall biosynthesis